MAKRSQRRPVRFEKDQVGCIWGWIGIFNFRHGRSTHRMLSGGRWENKLPVVGAGHSRSELLLTNFDEKCQGFCDGDESEIKTGDDGKTSVKELMEEEMFGEQDPKKHIRSTEVEQKESNSEGRVKKNRKRTKKTSKGSCDIHCDLNAAENLVPENSSRHVSEQKISNNLDLEVIIKEFYQQIHHKSTSCVKQDWHDDLDIQSSQIYSVSEEKISEAIEVFVNQKFTNGKHLAEDGKIYQSKELMDALQTLRSNKELILKLVKDPDTLLVKQIQDLEGTRLEEDRNSKSAAKSHLLGEELSNSRPSEPVNYKQHKFFKRKSKSQKRDLFDGNENCQQPSNRIVVLKPVPAGVQNSETDSSLNTSLQSHFSLENNGQSERVASQFSFTEIRRKLKHAMGKERHRISSDGVTYKFPSDHQNSGNTEKGVGGENGGWGSPNRNHFYNERFARPSIGVKRGDQISKRKDTETSMGTEPVGYPEQRVSNIYSEAKKHLSKMLINEDGIEKFSSRRLPKTLGTILSLPEFNLSPISSPGRDRDHIFPTEQMKLSPSNNIHMVNENIWRQEKCVSRLGPSRQNLESESYATDDSPEDKVQASSSNLDITDELNHAKSLVETSYSMRDEMSYYGDVQIVNATDTVFQEKSEVLDVLAESSSITRDGQEDTAEVSEKKEYPQCLISDLIDEDESLSSPLASPSSSLIANQVEDLESANERTEQPSLTPVLEALLFTDDDISPASTKTQPVEPPMPALHQVFSATHEGICVTTCMEDEESTFEYVEAVLLGSDLNWDEFLLRRLSSDQLLDPSLFEEVELFPNGSRHDQKLLFDCTNEVLEEVCENYFGCSPRVSFIKQNIRPVPKGKDLIDEVWEGVQWHLLLQPPSHSMDHILRKDLVRTGTWMDLRFDSASIGTAMEEAILGELIEDTITSFLDEGLRSDLSALPAE
ncbi:uncharacterized protein LOC132276657 [Cornus florida]|uniref:uncharacterized protein LOC132276657 n=1 Tax=Cornus florida TaxID=4283 RepID=UPI002897FD7A|nr:uncharacterized protein LOC132276657 [Cornus florida]